MTFSRRNFIRSGALTVASAGSLASVILATSRSSARGRPPFRGYGELVADPGEGDTPIREQVIALGATPIQKAEGVWTGLDGEIWFVSSRGDGPDAEDPEDVSAAVHAGQIWRYDPHRQTMELVVIFPAGSTFDGPDNITAGPHGFAVACTDGEDEQWLVGITDDGGTFAFAKNPVGDDEFAGATFSPDGQTLYVNIQGSPARTFAIWGPWSRS